MQKIFKVKQGVLLAEKVNILYALDIEPGRVHQFNETAKVIFQLCMEPTSLEDLIQEYILYFDVSESVAQEDVLSVVGAMEKSNLLAESNIDEN